MRRLLFVIVLLLAAGKAAAQINPPVNSISPVTFGMAFSPLVISGSVVSLPTATEFDVGITTGGSIRISGAGCYLFNTRSQMCSPADGLLQVLNGAGTGFTRVVFGTNDGTANGWSLLRSGTYIETWTGDGTSARTGIKTSGLLNVGAFQSVNNIATVGSYGVPAIFASNRATGLTAASTNLCTYTPTADGSFEVSANVLITTATSLSFGVRVDYTDEGSTARQVFWDFVIPGSAYPSGAAAITTGNGAVPYSSTVRHIRAKSGVAINVSTVGTFTTVTYNFDCSIRQIS